MFKLDTFDNAELDADDYAHETAMDLQYAGCDHQYPSCEPCLTLPWLTYASHMQVFMGYTLPTGKKVA
jgi:hypothetical protein